MAKSTTKIIDPRGYVLLRLPNHRLADIRGYVYEHRVIAEIKLGRALKPKEIVHHIDGDPSNNDSENIDILPSIEYHRLKHRKQESKLRLPNEPNSVVYCKCGCGKIFINMMSLVDPENS